MRHPAQLQCLAVVPPTTGYSVTGPPMVTRPILLPVISVNHIAPSDPLLMPDAPAGLVGMAYSVNTPQMSPLNLSATFEVIGAPAPGPGVSVAVSVNELKAFDTDGRVSTNVFGDDGCGGATATRDESLDVNPGRGAPGPTMKFPSISMPTMPALVGGKHFEIVNPEATLPLKVEPPIGTNASETGTPHNVTAITFLRLGTIFAATL